MKNTLAENLLRFGVKNLSESEKLKLTEAPVPPKTTTYKPFKTPRSFTFKDQASYIKFTEEASSYAGGVRLMESAAFQPADQLKMFGPYFIEMKQQVQNSPKVPTQKSDLESRIQVLTMSVSTLAAMMGITDLVKTFPNQETYTKQAQTYRAMNPEIFGPGTGPEWPLNKQGFDNLKGQYWVNYLKSIAQPLFNNSYKNYVVQQAAPASPIAPATKN